MAQMLVVVGGGGVHLFASVRLGARDKAAPVSQRAITNDAGRRLAK